MKEKIKRWAALCIVGILVMMIPACGGNKSNNNLITFEKKDKRVVTLFSPMEKTKPDADNIARSASEKTVMVHIRRIREKLELNPKEPEYIKVVWGIGYKMEKK